MWLCEDCGAQWTDLITECPECCACELEGEETWSEFWDQDQVERYYDDE